MRQIDVIFSLSNLTPESLAERIKTINYSLETFYAKQSNIKLKVIIVIQQLQDETIGGIKIPKHLDVDFVHVKYGVYNKGWSLNVGIRHSNAEYIILADCDMWCPADYFSSLYEWAQKEKIHWAFAWDLLYYCTEKEKVKLLRGEDMGGECHRFLTPPKRGYTEGGLVIFRRESLVKMGGCNEWLQELGGIDSEMIERCMYFYGPDYKKFRVKVYHLWHPQKPKSFRPTRTANVDIIFFMRKNKSANAYLAKLDFGKPDLPMNLNGELPVLVKSGRVF